jgi:hypothetical protein
VQLRADGRLRRRSLVAEEQEDADGDDEGEWRRQAAMHDRKDMTPRSAVVAAPAVTHDSRSSE